MMRLLIFGTLLVGVLSQQSHRQQKQIKLEDLERENLASEKFLSYLSDLNNRYLPTKQQVVYAPPVARPIPQRVPQKQHGPPTPPKMQYGFVPVQEPQPKYTNVQPQGYTQAYAQAYTQVAPPQTYQHTGPQTFEQPDQSSQSQVQYVPQYVPQTPTQQGAQYLPQPQPGVQYVVDNQLPQGPQDPSQYYFQLQQYTASSNSIQAVSDGKGQVQYVMYVPAPQNYQPETDIDSLLQASYAQTEDTQYTLPATKPQTSPKYTTIEIPKTPLAQNSQPSHYVQSSQYAQSHQSPTSTYREPQSLLDSYIPSIVQYNYYKQQQSNINSLRPPPLKSSSYNPYKRNQPKHKNIVSDSSNVNFKYQVPQYTAPHVKVRNIKP